MKLNHGHAVIAIAVICVLLIINSSGIIINREIKPQLETPSSPPPTASEASTGITEIAQTPETPISTPTPTKTISKLVPYNGIVQHLFFHEIIAYPELAFNGNHKQEGYDTNMVTVSEFNKILKSIYDNGYVLVDMNDVWFETVDSDGKPVMKRNTLMLPEGKKPIILSFDDICFYEYMKSHGFMERLVIGDNGEIWAEGDDLYGNKIKTQDLTAVTVLDNFIKEYPDFSPSGIKGCIALTGYEGILGYRTQTNKDDTSTAHETNRQLEIARVRPIIKKLKESGWYFASHSWGHINLNTASLDAVREDAERWLNEVGSLVGETKLFIYPFGSRLDGGDVYDTGPAFEYYHSLGFRIFASVGIESFSKIKTDIPAVVCDRMHADGSTLRFSRDRYMIFYDAKEVIDPLRPAEYVTNW